MPLAAAASCFLQGRVARADPDKDASHHHHHHHSTTTAPHTAAAPAPASAVCLWPTLQGTQFYNFCRVGGLLLLDTPLPSTGNEQPSALGTCAAVDSRALSWVLVRPRETLRVLEVAEGARAANDICTDKAAVIGCIICLYYFLNELAGRPAAGPPFSAGLTCWSPRPIEQY